MTFYCLDKQHVLLLSNKDNKSVDDNVPDNIVNKYTEEILDYVLYDSERCLAVEQFEPVKNNTHCVFAKTAKLWGSRDYDITLSLEENVKRFVTGTSSVATGDEWLNTGTGFQQLEILINILF